MDDVANTESHQLEFKGDGTEYFKIWIVNVLFSIITLGIYSAWAKVRNSRYLYANLYINQENFEYLANPIAILKGRIIAVSALLIYSITSSFYPVLGLFMLVGLILVMPYLIVRSLAFGRRMTSHRNIRFRFNGKYGEGFVVFIIWPLLAVISFGILYPLTLVKINRFIVENTAYGTTGFRFIAGYKDYGRIVLIAICLFIGAFIVSVAVALVSLSFGTFLIFPMVYAILFYINSNFHNIFFNSSFLTEHSFTSTVTTQGFIKVAVINGVLIVLTLGLYLPAAKVRKIKYLCSQMKFNAAAPLDEFVAAEQEQVSSLGEEIGDAFDIDIGLGF